MRPKLSLRDGRGAATSGDKPKLRSNQIKSANHILISLTLPERCLRTA